MASLWSQASSFLYVLRWLMEGGAQTSRSTTMWMTRALRMCPPNAASKLDLGACSQQHGNRALNPRLRAQCSHPPAIPYRCGRACRKVAVLIAPKRWSSSNVRYASRLTQVTTLSRLRHPCILEVVEPMEESRGELTFATERVSMSLSTSLSARSNPDNQLDEIEIRKGLLQVRCAPHPDRALA